MAVTLADMFLLRKDDYEKGVYETWMQESDLSKILPMETLGTTEVTARRSNSIPTPTWRQRGQMFGPIAAGTSDTITDATYAMGATIDIDKTDMKDKNLLEDPVAERTKLAVKGAAWEFNNVAINGDHGVNPNAPEGLKVRIATLGSEQTIYANTSGAELNIAPASEPTTAVCYRFLDKIDEVKYALDGHTADICLTHADFIRAFKACLRRLNLYKDVSINSPEPHGSKERRTGSNANTKPVFEWDGVKYYDMGLKADQVTPIIGTTTVNSVACRPAYFLKLGKPYFHGIQQYPLEVSKPFMTDDGVSWRTVIDWPIGFRHIHPRFAAQLLGTKVA